VALRRLGNIQDAEEVTQAVFVILARKANRLGTGTVLSGWLNGEFLIVAKSDSPL
jgi:DNA-directed RNA polymerase specialized sigma24 family protein